MGWNMICKIHTVLKMFEKLMKGNFGEKLSFFFVCLYKMKKSTVNNNYFFLYFFTKVPNWSRK